MHFRTVRRLDAVLLDQVGIFAVFERSAAELGTQPAGMMMMMMMMMPGSACDTPQPKRKQVKEPTSAMKRRLAEHGDPRWPQEQCDSMTYRQLLDRFEELGLPGQKSLTVSLEDYNPNLSWEELQELKAAADEKAAADTPQPKRKRVKEPTSAMKRRLAEHGRSRWTQEQCESMTHEQLKDNFAELGLTKRAELTVSAEDYNRNLSWEELQELAADEKAADEKAAAEKREHEARERDEKEKAAEEARRAQAQKKAAEAASGQAQ